MRGNGSAHHEPDREIAWDFCAHFWGSLTPHISAPTRSFGTSATTSLRRRSTTRLQPPRSIWGYGALILKTEGEGAPRRRPLDGPIEWAMSTIEDPARDGWGLLFMHRRARPRCES